MGVEMSWWDRVRGAFNGLGEVFLSQAYQRLHTECLPKVRIDIDSAIDFRRRLLKLHLCEAFLRRLQMADSLGRDPELTDRNHVGRRSPVTRFICAGVQWLPW